MQTDELLEAVSQTALVLQQLEARAAQAGGAYSMLAEELMSGLQAAVEAKESLTAEPRLEVLDQLVIGALVSMYHQLGLFCHPAKVAQTQETAKASFHGR